MTVDKSDIKKAVETLRQGGLILYPTDTVWGIGCDATNSQAVKRIFELKRRTDSKALITLVGSAAALERTVSDVPDVAWQLIDAAVDPVTIIYDHGIGVAPEVLAPDGSLAVRLTNEDFSKNLCMSFGKPLISTSANISGQPTPKHFGEISQQIIDNVDYVCTTRQDDTTLHNPSMVIKISDGGLFKILRK